MESENRGLDLEKELTCSVSYILNPSSPSYQAVGGLVHDVTAYAVGEGSHRTGLLILLIIVDLYRSPLSTSHSPGLSPYFLRLLLEGVVQLATQLVAQLSKLHPSRLESLYLPVMSCASERYQTQRDCDYFA